VTGARIFVQRTVRCGFDADAPCSIRRHGLRHSRRIDPINVSAKPFCQGGPGAMGLSPMPIARVGDECAVDPIPIRISKAEPQPKEMRPLFGARSILPSGLL
jgi:hypothetical protein